MARAANTSSLFGLFLIAVFGQVVVAGRQTFGNNQFQHWYPQFAPVFEYIRDNNCSAEYDIYLTQNASIGFNSLTGGYEANKFVQPLVDCMLDSASEFIKSSMGSAQVLLGLTPSMLSVLGSSIEEVAVLCTIGRRQFLSLLIIASAPAVFPDRAFKLEGPIKILDHHEGRLDNKVWHHWTERLIVLVEYTIALASIVNIVHACYWLQVQSVSNFAPQISYFPALWTWLGISTHIVGCVSMHLRIDTTHHFGLKSIARFIKFQFIPFTEQTPMVFEVKKESYPSIVLCWLSSIMVMTHLIFGSLVWSSFLFISVGDAVRIIIRFAVSALAARGLLMYELGMLRHVHNDPQRSSGTSECQLVQTNSYQEKGDWHIRRLEVGRVESQS